LKKAAISTLLVAVLLAAGAVLAHGRRSGSAAGVPTVQRLLAARLRAHGLSVHELTCVRNGRTYHGAPLVRCNANFGDPHVQAYCAIVSGGHLVTNADRSSIPCGHDDAGFSAAVESY
jgi:hypothetical protein